MRLCLVVALVCAIAGCSAISDSQERYNLRWQFADDEAYEYDVVYVEVDPDPQLQISGSLASSDSQARAHIKQLLGDMDLPVASYRATVAQQDQHIHARVVGIMPEFELPPVDWKDEYDRALIASNVGNVMLTGDFSVEGELLSFFLARPQKNLSNLLFSLPPTALQPGDSWPLDVYGLQLGSGFIADDASRNARAYLESVQRDEQGRQVAEVFYLLEEAVSGHFRIRQGEELQDVPITTTFTFVAHAHFLIEEGRWLDYTGLGVQAAADDAPAVVTLYALRPVER